MGAPVLGLSALSLRWLVTPLIEVKSPPTKIRLLGANTMSWMTPSAAGVQRGSRAPLAWSTAASLVRLTSLTVRNWPPR